MARSCLAVHYYDVDPLAPFKKMFFDVLDRYLIHKPPNIDGVKIFFLSVTHTDYFRRSMEYKFVEEISVEGFAIPLIIISSFCSGIGSVVKDLLKEYENIEINCTGDGHETPLVEEKKQTSLDCFFHRKKKTVNYHSSVLRQIDSFLKQLGEKVEEDEPTDCSECARWVICANDFDLSFCVTVPIDEEVEKK